MKILSIDAFNEKLKINPINASDIDELGFYEFFPKDKYELKETIKERMNKDGMNCDLNMINTSSIKDFSYLFEKISEFNGDLSRWNTSKAYDMSHMFEGCSQFNCNISSWDVSNVKNMSRMFSGCKKFNQNLNDWNVSNVKYMDGMFAACFDFDQPLDKWHDKLHNVISMRTMFYNCHSFNQDLSSWIISTDKTNTYDMFVSSHHIHYNVIDREHMPKFI